MSAGHLPSIEAAYRAGFAAGTSGGRRDVDRRTTKQEQDAWRLGYRDATGQATPPKRHTRIVSGAERDKRIIGQRARRARERSEAADGSR